jgi:hypothetical protein
MVDINDVISLDYIDYVLDDEELEKVIEMVEADSFCSLDPFQLMVAHQNSYENDITLKAKEFIKSYKRNKKIEKII